MEVRGLNRASASSILAASRLVAGEAYDESDIGAAAARIRRLPFVHDAEVRLIPGTERGFYRVVFEVDETTRYFVAADLELLEVGDEVRFDPRGGATSSELGADVAAGLRFFPGGDGLFTVGWTAGAVSASYSHFDVGGRGILGTAEVAVRPDESRWAFALGLDPTLSTWHFDSSAEITLGLGIPLAGNQLLSGSITALEAEESSNAGVSADNFSALDAQQRRAELAWTFDTTDDPLFARKGRRVRAGLSAATFEASSGLFLFGEGDTVASSFGPAQPDSRLYSAHVAMTQNWPLGPRATTSLEIAGSVGVADVGEVLTDNQLVDPGNLDVVTGRIELALASDLWLPQVARKRGDLRWEARVGYGTESISPRVGVGSVDRFELSLGVLYRAEWGVIRLGVSYLDLSVGRDPFGGPA